MSEKFDTYCGLCCETCTYKESHNCGGCIATDGKPFYGECTLAKCANEKKRRFCGECEHFPCELLNNYSFDKEHGDNGERIENCKRIKNELVAEARDGLDPISYCGFHCDCCFLGQWCGGCRSSYNCCSFATLYEDGICPNVKCCREKNIEGCYECDMLESCEKGFYSKTDEFLAKAAAMFIKKHGKAAYDRAIRHCSKVNNSTSPEGFNATGSVEGALKMLEEYMTD